MDFCDVVIVGGGPAGSSCAWRLKQHGIDSLILDAEDFPRAKLCAGWITPAVLRNLKIDPAAYPHDFVTFTKIRAEYFWRRAVIRWVFKTTQYSIRRYEFDHWLLQRSCARVQKHRVRVIIKDGNQYVLDDLFRCRYLVGAGGTHCPVFRAFFSEINPRSRTCQVAALEEEFVCDYRDDSCRLWFFENGMRGYAWYVPKGNGWINVGLGALSTSLKDGQLSLHDHWRLFTLKLADLGLVTGHEYKAAGHTYYVREPAKVGQLDTCLIAGDSAGLATSDLGEGIGPAVESGLRAADAIATGRPYSLEGVTRYSLEGMTRYSYLCLLRKSGEIR